MGPNAHYSISMRQRPSEVDMPSYTSYYDRKASEATVIHRPSTSSHEPAPWSVDDDRPSLPVATKENDYLGFCPSAVKLQNADRKGALRKRTDYSASFAAAGLTTYYCSHKGCMFAGHSSVDFAWKTVMKDERLGIKCRWPFLAKSHVKNKTVTGRQYQFQCPICIYTHGHAEGRIWKGVELFMEHVSTHRGKELAPELLHKLCIVNDRTADEKEEFDINLIPPSRSSTYSNNSSSTTNSNSNSNNNTNNSIFYPRESISSGTTTPSTTSSSLHPPSRSQTFSSTFSFADSIWSRKASSAPQQDPTQLTRTHTNRSDRADSVFSNGNGNNKNDDSGYGDPMYSGYGNGANYLGQGGSWSEGLSVFRAEREEDYLSPDF